VICGVNWYSSFDQPATDGTCPLTPNAYVRGGHEVCIVGLDVASRTLRFANSWSAGWGSKGYGVWSYDTFTRLLAEDGDVTVPVSVA
jgi:C1A family cysteine protease